MAVAMVDVQTKVPKELNDVRLALVKVVSLLAVGQNPFGVMLQALNELNVAVDGFKAIPQEAKEQLGRSVACVGLIGADIVDALKPPQV